MWRPPFLCAFTGSYNPKLLAISHLGSLLCVLIVQLPLMSENMWCLVFCSCVSLLKMMVYSLIHVTANSSSWVQMILLLQPPKVGYFQHAWLIFVFLVEMGFHHVGLASLQLLFSSDPPTLASQSAEITGMSHHA